MYVHVHINTYYVYIYMCIYIYIYPYTCIICKSHVIFLQNALVLCAHNVLLHDKFSSFHFETMCHVSKQYKTSDLFSHTETVTKLSMMHYQICPWRPRSHAGRLTLLETGLFDNAKLSASRLQPKNRRHSQVHESHNP